VDHISEATTMSKGIDEYEGGCTCMRRCLVTVKSYRSIRPPPWARALTSTRVGVDAQMSCHGGFVQINKATTMGKGINEYEGGCGCTNFLLR